MFMRLITLLLTLLVLSGCATSPTGRNQLMLVSPEQAIASSKEAYIQTLAPLDNEGRIDSNPAVSRRVRLITGRLIAQAIQLFPRSSNWEWSIKVIDDPEVINAWCMAGGKMAIYTGLLNQIHPTDDELAQVMAHEISHALANHTAEKMSVAMASQLGLLGVAIASSNSGNQGAILAGSAAAAALAVQLPNSRAAEIEADRLGIELAARAGYDPRAAVTLWQKMEQAGGSGPPQFLSTHPSPGNRQAALKVLADQVMVYYLDPSPKPVYTFPSEAP